MSKNIQKKNKYTLIKNELTIPKQYFKVQNNKIQLKLNENQDRENVGSDQLFNKEIEKHYSYGEYMMIKKELQKKNFTLIRYIASGGQGDVFEGYLQNEGVKEECVFKIYFNATYKQFQKEIDIMKSFEKPINVVKIIDSVQIQSFFILVLEKCLYSLKYELEQFQSKQNVFSFEILLQIVFDLLFGLIQFRIYNILHLDIKPSNILISQQGNYCYCDFGTSFQIQQNQKINIEFLTRNYASPEQKENESNTVSFSSDVYSLGITLQKVLQVFKKANEDDDQKEQEKTIILNFEKIIEQKMINQVSSKRSECLNLLAYFFDQFKAKEYHEQFKKYLNKLYEIIHLYPYDLKKDIYYFLEFKLFYNLIIQKLIENHQEQYFIQKQQSNQEVSIIDLDLQQQKQIKIFQISERNQPEETVYIRFCFSQSQINLKYLQEFLQIREQILLGNQTDKAACFNIIGLSYMQLGENKKSLDYLQKSLKMRKEIFKENQHTIAASLSNVGICYIKLGDSKNGLKYSLESLEMRKLIFQGNHPDIAESLNNVGICYLKIGDNQNGLKYLLQSLEMRKEIFKNYKYINVFLNNLKRCIINFCESDLKYYFIQKREELLEGIHPDIAESLNNVGNCFINLGDSQEGLKYSLVSLKMRQQIFQGNHPDIASSLNNVGLTYMKLGDNLTGLKYLFKSLQISKQIFQGNHTLTATSLNNLGTCYNNLYNKKKSLKYFLQSLKMREKILRKDHPDIAESLNNVGICYMNLGEYQKGLIYFYISFEMRKQIFKGNHTEIETSLNNLVFCYTKLYNKQISVKYFQKSLQKGEQIIQRIHPEITKSLKNNNLMCLNHFSESQQISKQIQQGKYPIISEKCFQKSLQKREQIIQIIHPEINKSLKNIRKPHRNIKKHLTGLNHFSESQQISKQILQGKYPIISAKCFFKSLQKNEQIIQIIPPEITKSLKNLEKPYKNIENHSTGLNHFSGSQQISKQILQGKHPFITVSQINIKICYTNFVENVNSKKYSQIFLQMRICTTSLNYLGTCFTKLGDNQKNLKQTLKCLQIRIQIIQGSNIDSVKSFNTVGMSCTIIGYNQNVFNNFQESIFIKNQLFKRNHPKITSFLNNLITFKIKPNQQRNNLKSSEKSQKMRKNVLQEKLPDKVASLNNIIKFCICLLLIIKFIKNNNAINQSLEKQKKMIIKQIPIRLQEQMIIIRQQKLKQKGK